MDAVRFGRGIRALRHRRGWRQSDLAGAAGVTRSAVSRVELGRSDRLTVRTLDAIAAAIGARVEVRLSWNGEALDRLLDSAHARLVEAILARLATAGWQSSPEVSFNIFGERGSIDVFAVHRPTGSLLVVEVKSVVPDLQAMLASLDRKARLAGTIAAERGWPASSVSRLLVIGDARTARRRVEAFEVTLRRSFPVRGWAVDRWLHAPDGHAIAGLRFLSDDRQGTTRHRIARPEAVIDTRFRTRRCHAPTRRADGGTSDSAR